jgi:hypothetical protein
VKKAAIVAVSLVFGALSWLALDDITTGSEPSHALEWGIVVLTMVWFTGLAVVRRQNL